MLALHKPEAVLSLRHMPSWVLLSMAAGLVNATTLLACQRFVTHVTGTVTHLGTKMGTWWLFIDFAIVLGCFIGGAMTSVVMIDRLHLRGKRPQYALPLGVVAGLLCLTSALGQAGLFGAFGMAVDSVGDFVLLSLLSFAMGLQNASVATSTGQMVRTTHLTGPSTDLGVQLASAALVQGTARQMALRGVGLRAGIIAAFCGGAALSVPLAARFQYLAYLFPAALVVVAAALSFVEIKNEQPLSPQAEPSR